MRIPDKLLRAELSMLQDEIRMAQQMMENPLTATMNAPRGKFLESFLHLVQDQIREPSQLTRTQPSILTVNLNRLDLATMLSRMAEQLEQ